MKSIINIEYSEHKIGNRTLFVGWATDYYCVVVQAWSLEQMEHKILVSLKVLYLHFLNLIENKTIKTQLKKQ